MKKQITKKLSAFISIIVTSILIFNGSCSKDIKSPDSGNTITGASKIVYTDVNPDSVILKSEIDSFKLDLNNDGITDFEFDRFHIVLCDDNFLGTWAYESNLYIKPASGNNSIMTSGSNFPLALDSSTAIAKDSLWATTSQVLLDGATYATGHCITTLPTIHGYWLNVSDKYIGFKFIKANNTYYGWARLSSSYSRAPLPYHNLIVDGQLILKDYAYNSIPDQPILAGQTK